MNTFKRALFFVLFACAGAGNLLTMLPDELRSIARTMEFGKISEEQSNQLISFFELNLLPDQQKKVLQDVIENIYTGTGASDVTQLRDLADFIEQEQLYLELSSVGSKRKRNFSDHEEQKSKVNKQTNDDIVVIDDDIVQVIGKKQQNEIPSSAEKTGNSNMPDEEGKSKLKKLTDDDDRLEEVEQEGQMSCFVCMEEYTETSANKYEIACCKNYHLFCVKCIKELKNKNSQDTCFDCNTKLFDQEGMMLCGLNSPDETNYQLLRALLASCTDADVRKKQVLKLLLKRGQAIREITSDLVLPTGDSDVSDEGSDDETPEHLRKIFEKEARRIFCAICKDEIEDRPMMLSCGCKNVYHELCAIELIADPKICSECHTFVNVVEKQQ